MAEKKERKIVSAAEAKGETVTKTKTQKVVDTKGVETSKSKKPVTAESWDKKGRGLRIFAIILWLLAIACEVAAIYMININETTIAIIAIVVDAVFCIIGSLLWKRANRFTPSRSKNKFVKFIWDQMGVIACIIAFIPLGLYILLKADNISPKMKKTLAIIAAAAFLGSTAASVDYNPATPEQVDAAKEQAIIANENFDGTVYWTRWGKSYHIDLNCFTLNKSTVLIEGTIEEAFEAKRNDPCDFCVLIEDDDAQ